MSTFDALARTGCVEFLGETYYHSLSFFYSKDEFAEQMNLHRQDNRISFRSKTSHFPQYGTDLQQ